MSYETEHNSALKPLIVCLCGSTRFRESFHSLNAILTRQGAIVLAPGVFGHMMDEPPISEEEKSALDRLHFKKIEMSDMVMVVTPNGYIGDSTRAEIAYAKQLGKVVQFWPKPNPLLHDDLSFQVPDGPTP